MAQFLGIYGAVGAIFCAVPADAGAPSDWLSAPSALAHRAPSTVPSRESTAWHQVGLRSPDAGASGMKRRASARATNGPRERRGCWACQARSEGAGVGLGIRLPRIERRGRSSRPPSTQMSAQTPFDSRLPRSVT